MSREKSENKVGFTTTLWDMKFMFLLEKKFICFFREDWYTGTWTEKRSWGSWNCLQMAADHYKEKFKECQRLQKQINKLSDQSQV